MIFKVKRITKKGNGGVHAIMKKMIKKQLKKEAIRKSIKRNQLMNEKTKNIDGKGLSNEESITET